MQAFISTVSSQLRSRPLLVVAGAAVTTAGLYYLYRRFGDRQQRQTATDISCSTEHEDPVQITEAEKVVNMCSPIFCGPVIAYTCPKLVLEQQIFKSYQTHYRTSSPLCSPPTSPAWDHASSGPWSQPTTPPFSPPASPSRSLSVTPPWTPPTSPPQAQPTCAWTEPTSPSEEVVYMCSPIFCGPMIAYTCPKLVLEQQIFKSYQTHYGTSSPLCSPPTSPAWDHASSGPWSQPTTPTFSPPASPSRALSITPPWTPPTSPPQAQPTCAWTEPTSPSETSSAPSAQSASPFCDGLAADLQPELASPAQSESATPPPPEPVAPSHSADEQSASEEVGDSVSTGTWQVPTLHAYLKPKRINNFSLRLAALRQAFSITLGHAEYCNYVCLAGRSILGGLATLNLRYLTAFHEAYDSLLLVAQNPSYVGQIETELAQIGIQEFNFIDIVYELVLLGILGGARPQIFPRPGGFLRHLENMLTSFSDVTILRMPRADQYMFLVQNEMLLLLEEIFSMEEYVYEDPGHLAAVVWEYLQYHMQQLLAILEAI